MWAVKRTLEVIWAHCPLIFLPPPHSQGLKPSSLCLTTSNTLHLKDHLLHRETTWTIGKLLLTLSWNLFFYVYCLPITVPCSGGHRASPSFHRCGGPSDSSLPSIILELGKFLKYLAAYPEASLIKSWSHLRSVYIIINKHMHIKRSTGKLKENNSLHQTVYHS